MNVHTEGPRFTRIYCCLFFALGLTLGFRGKYHWLSLCALLAFYMLHHGMIQRNLPMRKSFMIFFTGCLIFMIHLASVNLFELLRYGYVPFHGVLGPLGGVKTVITHALKFSAAYAAFRCLQGQMKPRLFSAFACGGVCYTLIFLILLRNMVNFDNFGSGEGRISIADESEGIYWHPNLVAYLYMLFFYVNVLSCHYARQRMIKAFHVFFCIFSVFIIVLGQSRTSLAALLLGGLLAFSLSKKRILIALLLMTLTGMFFIVIDYHPEDLLPRRYTLALALEDKAAGRTSIWADYLEYATMQDWLFGRGMSVGEESILYQKPLRAMKGLNSPGFWAGGYSWMKILYTHNNYLYILFHVGIVGLTLYCCLALMVLFRLLKKTLHKEAHWAFPAMWCAFLIWGCFEADFVNPNALLFWPMVLSQSFPVEQ